MNSGASPPEPPRTSRRTLTTPAFRVGHGDCSGVQLVPFSGLISPSCQTERRTSRLGALARGPRATISWAPTSAL
jgi:hypothetical protein